jgi:hypothetical protein
MIRAPFEVANYKTSHGTHRYLRATRFGMRAIPGLKRSLASSWRRFHYTVEVQDLGRTEERR